jgi:hypothetical protein
MYNRVEVESAIMELKDLAVLTTMIRNNSETITSAEEFESLFSVVADALISKVTKLHTAFYGSNI